MGWILESAMAAAKCEGKNPNRPHMLNPNERPMVGRIAGAIYEALWMEERLQDEKWKRESIIDLATAMGEYPYSKYASLIEGERWVKAIRVCELITVIPAIVAGIAYLLKDKEQTS